MMRRDILSGATMQTKTSMMREGCRICKSVCAEFSANDFAGCRIFEVEDSEIVEIFERHRRFAGSPFIYFYDLSIGIFDLTDRRAAALPYASNVLSIALSFFPDKTSLSHSISKEIHV